MNRMVILFTLFGCVLARVGHRENQRKGRLDCKIAKCPVTLPHQDTSNICLQQHAQDLVSARHYYKLTVQGERQIIRFPLTSIPWLNQTMETVKMKTAVDPFESRWLSLTNVLGISVNRVKETVKSRFQGATFFTIAEYRAAFYAFQKGMKAVKVSQYFSNPAMDPSFTNVIDNDAWNSDDIFVQRRLAGNCPFLLRRVTAIGDVGMSKESLKKQLNLAKFNFDEALSDVYGSTITLDEAIAENILYALYHEEHNDLVNVPDQLDTNPNDARVLMHTTSPITLFVRNSEGILKVAAIQWDYKPDSVVYTPKSTPIEWERAKAMADLTDLDICQAKHHLTYVHFSVTIFCIVFRRHFSRQHPIYDVLKFHCEGTSPHIALAYPALAAPKEAGHLLFTIGHVGFVKVSSDAFATRKYGMLDYNNLLKSRGLDDNSIHYHPFRDDGKLIWDELKRVAHSFVTRYYTSDADVQNDKQLQNFANEISSEGSVGPDGGKGKFDGFPSTFTAMAELELFVTRFIWYNVYHTAVNYAVIPWSSFVPSTPTKLYNDTNPGEKNDFAHMLAGAENTIGILAFGSVLGNLRINRIMDHYDKVQDRKLQRIVWKSYSRFHSCIQKELENRNAKRKANNQLTYQYFEPKWLTNSIHI